MYLIQATCNAEIFFMWFIVLLQEVSVSFCKQKNLVVGNGSASWNPGRVKSGEKVSFHFEADFLSLNSHSDVCD